MFAPLGMEVIVEDGKEEGLFGGKFPALSIEFPVLRHHRVWMSQDRRIAMMVGKNDHAWGDLELTDPDAIRPLETYTEPEIRTTDIIEMVGVAQILEALGDIQAQYGKGVDELVTPLDKLVARAHIQAFVAFLVEVPAMLHGPYTPTTKTLAIEGVQALHLPFIEAMHEFEPGAWPRY